MVSDLRSSVEEKEGERETIERKRGHSINKDENNGEKFVKEEYMSPPPTPDVQKVIFISFICIFISNSLAKCFSKINDEIICPKA